MDTVSLNGAIHRGIVPGGGETERGAVGQWEDRLNRPLPKSPGSHNERPPCILKGPGHYLRSAGTSFIHQYYERPPVVVVCMAVKPQLLVLFPSFRVPDESICDEPVRDVGWLDEKPPGIIPQVEQNALETALCRFLKLLDCCLHILACLLMELGDPDVAIRVVEQLERNAFDLDAASHYLELLGTAKPLPHDGQGDGLALPPSDMFQDIVGAHVSRGLAVDLHDFVSRLQACSERGCALQHLHCRREAVLDGEFNADPAELACQLRLLLPVLLRCEEGRMRIERTEHPLDRGVDQVLVGHTVDILLLHDVQYLGVRLEILIRLPGLGAFHRSACRDTGHNTREKNRREQESEREPRFFTHRSSP